MRFITGGAYQGKLEYALKKYGIAENECADAAHAGDEEIAEARLVWNLQDYIRLHQHGGKCSLPEMRRDAVVICDEIGSGIVPAEREEREYREAAGRVCCRLAEEAESVEVVRFGIARRIK